MDELVQTKLAQTYKLRQPSKNQRKSIYFSSLVIYEATVLVNDSKNKKKLHEYDTKNMDMGSPFQYTNTK